MTRKFVFLRFIIGVTNIYLKQIFANLLYPAWIRHSAIKKAEQICCSALIRYYRNLIAIWLYNTIDQTWRPIPSLKIIGVVWIKPVKIYHITGNNKLIFFNSH